MRLRWARGNSGCYGPRTMEGLERGRRAKSVRPRHDQTTVRGAREFRDSALNLAGVLRIGRRQFHAARRRHRTESPQIGQPRWIRRHPKDGHRELKPELYPQKHGQEDQDRVERDPHDVGSPTPPILDGLLAHAEFSLA